MVQVLRVAQGRAQSSLSTACCSATTVTSIWCVAEHSDPELYYQPVGGELGLN